MDFVQVALEELAKNSPYAVIVIALMVFFYFVNRSNLKQIRKMYMDSIKEIRQTHETALNALREVAKESTHHTSSREAKVKK